MKKSKISSVIDYIFYFSCIFLAVILWARFFIHNTATVIIIASIIAVAISILLLFILKDRKNKINLTEKEKKFAEQFADKMSYYTQKEQCVEICKIFNINLSNIKKSSIIFKKCAIVPLFQYVQVDFDTIMYNFANLKSLKIEKIIFIAKNFTNEAKNFENRINDISISFVNKYQFAKTIHPLNVKVELKQKIQPSKKEKIFNLLNIAFNKSKSKNYFMYGIVLFICSLFFRYNVYYIIFSSLMFCFSIFSRFNKKFNKKENVENFNFLNV